jgi:hypothetical protein
MKMYIVLRLLLAIHISGLVVMAGTTIIDYVTFRTVVEPGDTARDEFRGLLPLMSRYGAIVRAGGAVLLITGISMLALTDGVWWNQLWLKIKMALVLMLILNGALIGNSNGVAFRKIISEDSANFAEQSLEVRTRLNRFYISQLFLFFLIILTSSVKFDVSAD